ncbi:MAG: UdgX family uracil-DNA binding protein [Acetobacteraceae bacterium]
MRHVILGGETDFEGWRSHARTLALAGIPPEEVGWWVGSRPTPAPTSTESKGGFSVPRALVQLAGLVVQAREADRFDLLYRLIWLAQAGALALDDKTDAELARARRLALAVRAEGHRLRSQLRYLPIEGRYVGWFAPAHRVLEASAPLLARRFPQFAVSVLTPEASAHWDESGLRFGPAAEAAAVPDDAGLEAYWRGYGAEMLAASRPETSVPEAEPLVEDPWPPDCAPLGPVVMPAGADSGVAEAAREATDCRRCPLYGPAIQTVFGEGPAGARLVFVGEQPGDQEDVVGRPFVGPAGQMLDRALAEAGIDRRSVYVTNAVKHFKFTPRGKRRIHQTPDTEEVRACAFWLDVERVRLRPELIVLLGGTAARAVLGRAVTIGRERGRPIRLSETETAFVTVHPSFLLRVPDEEAKRREYRAFVEDLRKVAAAG